MNAKLRPILLAAGVAFATSAFADGNIKGSVFSKEGGNPLDFVSVMVFDSRSNTPLQIIANTDADGSFILRNVPSGQYKLRFDNIGSKSEEVNVVVGNEDVDLGRVLLADDVKLLEEVVVEGQRSRMSVNSERKQYNVSANISSTGANAEELIGQIPSVYVDSEGEISLRGNSNVLVLIDGKEMGMNADNRSQFLRQIPAESIGSIEVLTNPSARHSTEGTGGIINIILKDDDRHGYFGSLEADIDSRGTAGVNFNLNYNEGKFETFAALGLKHSRVTGGVNSFREYDNGNYLASDGSNTKRQNSMFLRLGTNYKPDEHNTFFISAVGTLGHKWGNITTNHRWFQKLEVEDILNHTKETGDNRGANILLGYRHDFGHEHHISANVSYNIWQGPNDNASYESSRFYGTSSALYENADDQTTFRNQHQDVRISNWEASIDYEKEFSEALKLEAGYKGNYNHENSPASYMEGVDENELKPLDNLYNRFVYDTDITALYVALSGNHGKLRYSAGLRGEAWQTRTRSLSFGETDAMIPWSKRNDFSLFPSANLGWNFNDHNEISIHYSRRIQRPFGPQLNTFENLSDPSEVHLGNPLIQPEYSNAVELTYIGSWGAHMLSLSGYMRANNDMISHISFLAPMAADPDMNTMYYGHANVGNMVNAGLEIISRNTLFKRLTLTTSVNLYNSHLKGWTTEYPLHGNLYAVHGDRQNRFVWDLSCQASVRLPWNMSFQATGRYNSKRIEPQGLLGADWDVEAGLKKNFGPVSLSLICKDIFNSKKTCNTLYGNGYVQHIDKWSGGRTLRLSLTFNFGKKHESHDHDHDHETTPHNEVDTGGYGEESHHHHNH